MKVFVAIKAKKTRNYFCSAIIKSDFFREAPNNQLKFSNFADRKLGMPTPDLLLIDIDLWTKFRTDIPGAYPDLKILVVTSYEAYIRHQASLDEEFLKIESSDIKLGFGFISNGAQPKDIVSAIETVLNNDFYRYSIDNPEAFNPPEWLNTNISKIMQPLNHDPPLEKIVKLSLIIDEYKENRIEMIKNLPRDEKAQLNAGLKDVFMESLMIRGYDNHEIAGILDVDNLPQMQKTVRINRMGLIHRLADNSSVSYIPNINGQIVEINPTELEYLYLIAAGYTNEDIAKVRSENHNTIEQHRRIQHNDPLADEKELTINTVKTQRRKLIDKFKADSTMTMVNHALRMGLIKSEIIDHHQNLLNDNELDDHSDVLQLSQLIEVCEKKRIEMIKNLPAEEKDQINTGLMDHFIEYLIIKGYNDWEISEIFNNHHKEIKMNRMRLIYRIADENSMSYIQTRYRDVIPIEPDMLKYVRLIARKYTNDLEAIAKKIKKTVNEVKAYRNSLIENFAEVPIEDPVNFNVYIPQRNYEIVTITPAELESIRLIAAGYTNEDIADILNKNRETFITQRKNLREKFTGDPIDDPDRDPTREFTERSLRMVIKALQMGLIKLEIINKIK